MTRSMLTQWLVICTIISNLYCAPIDDEIRETTLSPSSLSQFSEKELLLAEDASVINENDDVVNDEFLITDVSSGDDSVSETTQHIVLDEDIAFFMPKTTAPSTISSSDDIEISTSIKDDIDATTTTLAPPPTTTKVDLKPIIVNELSSVEVFTPGMPFVLICEAQNPSTSDVFFTQPIKYSWNKNGRPFDELNDPSKQIYSESVNNGNILFVAPTSPADEGTYQCIAENQFGKSYSRGAVVMENRRNGSPRAIVFDSETSPIKGEPVVSIVPENVPDFGLREPKNVFYVFPTNQEETEEVEVINMLPASAIDEEENSFTESETIDSEKEALVNDLTELLDGEDDISIEGEDITAEKEKILKDVQNLVQGLLEESNTENDEGSGDQGLEDLLNSDPSDGLDLRSA